MSIVVDGSIGEGGGQILRTALGLATVLGKVSAAEFVTVR